jgi:hypothetical protein
VIDTIFNLSANVRYVSVYSDDHLESKAKPNASGASSSESDRYEELLVNPALLKLASQRGNIDCGGLSYLLVRYGNFFQLVVPTPEGHVSVCIEPQGNVMGIVAQIESLITEV